MSELGRCRVELVTGKAGAAVVVGGCGDADEDWRVRGNGGCGWVELCLAESAVRKVWRESTQSESWAWLVGEWVSAATASRSVRARSWSKRLAPGITRGAG